MKLNFRIIGIFTLISLVSLASCKKDPTEAEIQAKLNTEIMQWMYDAMDEVYYWSNKLPSYSSVQSETDPEAFFNSLLYTTEDKWSWLTDDYAALQEEFAGTPKSMGISPIPGLFSGTDKVFIVVAYVYPGSPADEAGIKRGDIIMRINDKELNTENYYALFSQSSYTVTLGNYFNGSISLSSKTYSLTARIIDSNPIVFDTLFEINSNKIAYVSYVEFISGENNVLLDEFGLLMDDFKSKGATDLIVDLRYNPGGEITAANYLASCIAPATAITNKSVFVKFLYNSLVQLYFENEYGPNSENLVNKFTNTGHNIDFSRVFFLVSDRSASASELLMIGLEPYMDVYQIGDSTYGKYTGAWVLTDTNDPPKHNWAIVPIVSKYSNAVGLTGFKNGLEPDFYIKDKLLGAKAFGDLSDPMLSKAVEIITGDASKKKSAIDQMDFKKLKDPSFSIKANLILEKPDLKELLK